MMTGDDPQGNESALPQTARSKSPLLTWRCHHTHTALPDAMAIFARVDLIGDYVSCACAV